MMELSGAGAAREPLLERRRHDFVCGSVLLALVVALWVVSGVLTQVRGWRRAVAVGDGRAS